MFDAIKNYLALANGVSEVTRQRALAAAKGLVASGEATAEQVTNLADDLLTTSRNNRDTVLALVRYEVDRAMVRLGLATSEEFAALVQRLAAVEATVRDAVALLESTPVETTATTTKPPQHTPTAAPDPPVTPPASSPAPPAGALSRPTKRATKAARKAPSKRSPAKRSPAKRVAGGTSAGASSASASPRETPVPPVVPVARKAAKKAPGKKAPATKKAPAAKKVAPAKKALPPGASPTTAGEDA